MINQPTEKVTLHFDLSHCPENKEFSLGVMGLSHNLAQHTPDTLRRHRETNKALALLSAENEVRLTHFVENVELPSEVGMHLVTYENKDSNTLPYLALSFIHVPTAAKHAHFRQKRKVARESHVAALSHFGISLNALSPAEAEGSRFRRAAGAGFTHAISCSGRLHHGGTETHGTDFHPAAAGYDRDYFEGRSRGLHAEKDR